MANGNGYSGKRLFILRHALAMPASGTNDAARALSPKGMEDAKALGAFMKAQGFIPDLVLCSTAKRTRQTLDGLKDGLEIPATRFLDILYSGSAGDYLYEIQKIDTQAQNLLIVAHNPSIYELAILLSGYGVESHMQRLSGGYAPATLSVLNCQCHEWAQIQPAENELIEVKDPLDYNAPARPTRWM